MTYLHKVGKCHEFFRLHPFVAHLNFSYYPLQRFYRSMTSTPIAVVVEEFTDHSLPISTTSYEKAQITDVSPPDECFEGKKDVQVKVTEVSNEKSRRRIHDYVQSARQIFTKETAQQYRAVLWKFGKFVGPGAIITVAYVDPDNYQTAVSGGTEFKYKLLFMILVSNLVAIYLQVSTCPNSYSNADGTTGTGSQARCSDWDGSSSDESRLSSRLAQPWPLHYGRGSDCLY